MSFASLAISSPAYDVAAPSARCRSHDPFQNQPSLHHQAKRNPMDHIRENSAGDIPVKVARNIPAYEITQGDWLKLSSTAFREHTGNRPGAAKELAGEIECSEKTTRSWLAGEAAPSGILDLRAMARIPAYAALKRKLAAQESAMDPRVQETIQELHRMTMQLAGGPI